MRLGYQNTRTIYQRFSDAKLFHGWVREFARSTLRVSSETKALVRPGDLFRFTLHGHERDLHFNGRLIAGETTELDFDSKERKEFWFETEGRVLTTNPSGCARWETALQAFIKPYGILDAKSAVVLDASLTGVAVQSFDPYDKGELMLLGMQTPVGRLDLEGEVRYCRALKGYPAVYRVGLKVDLASRVDFNKWKKLLESVAEKAA